MKMFILTLAMGGVAIIFMFFAFCYSYRHKEVKRYKHKIVKWLLIGLSILTAGAFLVLATKYRTVFLELEIMVYVTAFVCCKICFFQKKMDDSQDNSKTSKKKITNLAILAIVMMIIDVILFFCSMGGYLERNIRFSDETEIVTTIEEFSIPEACKTSDAEFICIHNSREEIYYLYYICLNQIYEVARFSESQIDVIFSLEEESIPYIEKIVETSYMMNYNFEKYEKPRVKDTKEKVTYKLYLPEGKLKEYYDLKE